ncbi:unnamed protein product [Owenia fusiformis]|uniref:Protein amnionless n=1 Tax=Owenia fusiformis TaxID=6347 RepID=A0A8S4PLQ6_OWEFU|nr:unnamed protein product [Owenia fusiformis]
MTARGVFVVNLLFLIGGCNAVYKRWIPNTDFNNPSNWDLGRVPCKNNRIVFPESAPLVYMQSNTTLMNIVLPSNGEIVLGDYVTLGFSDKIDTSATCRGGDANFNRTSAVQWVDTNNWCVTAHPDDPCPSTPAPPMLDTEKVPCKYDDVTFPKGSAFYVNLASKLLLNMKSLTLNGQGFSTNTFSAYLTSNMGKKQFVQNQGSSPTRININGDSCYDVTGCACGNDQGNVLAAVCAVQSSRCTSPMCRSALTPTGHCCPICGAVIELDYGAGFRLERIKNMISEDIASKKDFNSSSVQMMLSKLSSGKIQVVLLDDHDGMMAVDVGRTVTRKIESDIKGSRIYAVTTVKMQVSESMNTPSPQTGGNDVGLSSGTLAGIIIAITVCILLIAVVGFILMRRKLGDDFYKFRRFGSKKGFTMEMGATSGFENPIYGTTGPITDMYGPKEIKLNLNITKEQNGNESSLRGFDNPMYESKGAKDFFSDPTKTDPSVRFNPIYSTEGIEDDSKM